MARWPVRRRLGVGEHALGSPACRQPGRQLLGPSVCRGPVPGHLRGQRIVARRLQRPRRALVQHDPLSGQQPGGHGLGQQRMPGPVRPIRSAGGKQPESV